MVVENVIGSKQASKKKKYLDKPTQIVLMRKVPAGVLATELAEARKKLRSIGVDPARAKEPVLRAAHTALLPAYPFLIDVNTNQVESYIQELLDGDTTRASWPHLYVSIPRSMDHPVKVVKVTAPIVEDVPAAPPAAPAPTLVQAFNTLELEAVVREVADLTISQVVRALGKIQDDIGMYAEEILTRLDVSSKHAHCAGDEHEEHNGVVELAPASTNGEHTITPVPSMELPKPQSVVPPPRPLSDFDLPPGCPIFDELAVQILSERNDPVLVSWREFTQHAYYHGNPQTGPVVGIFGPPPDRYAAANRDIKNHLGIGAILPLQTELNVPVGGARRQLKRIDNKIQLLIVVRGYCGGWAADQAISHAAGRGIPCASVYRLGDTVEIAKLWLASNSIASTLEKFKESKQRTAPQAV